MCPDVADLSPLEARFFPFPRFAVPDQPGLYIICVDSQPRLKQCPNGADFDPTTLGCKEPDYFFD